MANTRNEGDNHNTNALKAVTSEKMHLPGNGVTHSPSVPCTCPSSTCTLHPITDKTCSNPPQSSYLKTFMYDSSSDDDDNSRQSGNFSHRPSFTNDQVTKESDTLPRHPAKRRRITSSGSNSENDVNQSSFAASRHNSKKSIKSGTVCGMFGSKPDIPCYRPKFPSDESEDIKGASKLSSSPVRNNATRESSSLPAKLSKEFSETYNVLSIESSNSSRSTSPKNLKQESDMINAQSNEQTYEQTNEPVVRSRPEREAAAKAQDLIKRFGLGLRAKETKEDKDSDDDFYSDASNEAGVPKYTLDSKLLKSLVVPLQLGYRLYSQLRNDPNLKQDLVPFLYPVDESKKSTKEYYKKIEKPICLIKIEGKLQNLNYFSTPEIVTDIRLMLENCYRFNGIDSWISKQACKVEASLENRITLLPYSMKEKCSLAETSPHLTLYRDVCGRRNRTPRMYVGCSKSPIIIALEELTLYKEKEVEIMQVQQSRRQEAVVQENTVTLASFTANSADFKRITSSWEFISSCLMICVCQEAINLQFTVGALEVGLLYPKHSKYLGKLIVCLCANGKRARELQKQENVSYEEWSAELAGRVRYLYHLTRSHGQRNAQTRSGITDEMYATFGTHKTPLQSLNPENSLDNGRLFHELSIGERLTLIHTLCTSKVAISPRLQNCFLEYEAESLRPTLLGSDRMGNSLFHFPLWPEEVRVYMEMCPTEQTSDFAATDRGEVRCVVRNTDDLLFLIEKLQSSGVLHSPPEGRKTPNKRQLLRAAAPLIETLKTLHEELIPHQAHFLLVDTTIYKELAEATMKEDSLEPLAAPPTPPRPATPPPRLTSSPENVEEEEMSDDERESSPEVLQKS